MASCRYCADKITECRAHAYRNCDRWQSLTGRPCLAGHAHEPWPELAYREAPSGIPGVSRMVLVTRDN
jgi:hypothetical protein